MASALIISMIVHWSAAFVLLHTSSSETQNENPLKVSSSGFLPVQRDDLGIYLYVNMSSSSSRPISALVVVKECCIMDSFNMWICMNSIVLQEYLIQFDPKGTASAEFVYPAIYPYDLVGKCTVEVFNGKKSVLNHTVHFNTVPHIYHSRIWIMEKLNGFLYGETTFPQACQSRDEDSYDNCLPVSCPLKYHGRLNYFDPVERKCSSVPTCQNNTVYDKVNNHCKNMAIRLTEEDVKVMTRTYRHQEDHPVDWKDMGRLDCHHGSRKVKGTGCICDSGWTSPPIDFRNINPQTSTYHMCDRKLEGTYWVTSIYILLITVSLLSVTLLGTMAIFFIRRRKSSKNMHKIWGRNDDTNFCRKCLGWFFSKWHRKSQSGADADNEQASLLTSSDF